jgi:hypothetical protein
LGFGSVIYKKTNKLNKSVINVIVNFLNDQSNIDELEFLLEWIKESDNYELFTQYISIHHFSNWAMNKADQEIIIKQINKKIKFQKNKPHYTSKGMYSFSKYAAIIAMSFAIGYYLNQSLIKLKPIEEVIPTMVTLETSDGEQIIIEEIPREYIEIEGKIKVKKKSKIIIYEKKPQAKEFKYNTLNVPHGKRFNVELSDGSIVQLNSGTSIKFPVQFMEGKDREIEIEGEAFFDVAHDANNTFRVLSNGAIVEVYGTKFNFKNFPEDPFSEIILTQGSVAVKSSPDDKELVRIKPSFKAKLNKSGNDIEVSQVNTKLYTSWVDGRVVFRDENIENLITKLERLYNVSITNDNPSLSNIFFNATIFVENETIDDVLNYLKEVYNINYQVVNNKVIIR